MKLVAMCRAWISAHAKKGQFFFETPHPLKNAYKQFPPSPSNRAYAIIALLFPDSADLSEIRYAPARSFHKGQMGVGVPSCAKKQGRIPEKRLSAVACIIMSAHFQFRCRRCPRSPHMYTKRILHKFLSIPFRTARSNTPRQEYGLERG